ncbi:MAG: ATP-binding protein [Balneolaceae bacterium]|nr:ATP-binding protein [Balneolaceae bacterium]
MNLFKRIWNSYRRTIIRNCTDFQAPSTSLEYWQNRLFSASVIFLIPLSVVAVVPGIYMAYITDLKGLIAVDFLAIFTILGIAFLPGLTVYHRKLIFNGVLYVTSVTLLLYLGTVGPGLLYLLGITIFIVLSLDKKFGYLAVGLNTLICIVVGFMLYNEIGNFYIMAEYGLGSWIAVSSNLVILSAITVLLIPILFEGLQNALVEENKLKSELEIEQKILGETLEELKSKNDELERFAYTISHDLKEPLRMVRSFMGLLDKKYAPQLDEKAKSYIYYAVDGSRRMTESIDDLLEYSRIGRMYTNAEKLDLNEVVEDVKKIFSGELDRMNAEINTAKLPVIEGVPITLKMLFQNLISNALKYQPEGGKPNIEIGYKELDSHWQFFVKDNGIGIEQEYKEEIFRIFRRLHTNDQYSGTGMGLAICKKIVEQHGGEIWVESEEEVGSTFFFTVEK